MGCAVVVVEHGLRITQLAVGETKGCAVFWGEGQGG
jgi:hypothetical protein